MIKKLFNKINDIQSPNKIRETIINIVDFIDKNKLIFFQNQNDYNQENKETFKYNRFFKKINIPNDFTKNRKNKELFEEAKKIYGENALSVIVSHEFGHQTHHQFLRKQENLNNWDIGKFGDICLTPSNIAENPNQKLNDVNSFLKVDNNNANGIERFMQQNFIESYADCYSGLINYLKNDTKDIFNEIKNFREIGKQEIKNSNELSINNGQIIKGKFCTTEYFNYYGIENFQNNFINKISKDTILKLPIEAIHYNIQIESLSGLLSTMKEEAKSNDLFLLELKIFCDSRHKCSINNFFVKFENHLNDLKQFYRKGDLANNIKNTEQFNYDVKVVNLSKNDIVQEYKKTLTKEDLIRFRKANIDELKLNCFDEHYQKKSSNYGLSTISNPINDKQQVKQNILNLREKFLKEHTKSSSFSPS